MQTTTASPPPDLADLVQTNSPGSRSRRRRTIVLILLALGAVAFAASRSGQSKAPASQYVTASIERGDLSLTVTATGNLKPTNEVTVGSELSGTAREVLVETNALVTKGQPLALLDTRKLSQQTDVSRAALTSAKARVGQAQATVVEKEASLGRARELQRLSSGRAQSKAEMDTAIAAAERARADLASAEAAVEEATAQLQAIETDLAKATIVAPIDGTVLTRKLEPGQTVAATFTAPELFVIAENLERMKLKVAVAEADIGSVREGQTASFTVDAWPDRSYNAKVTKVAFGSSVTDNVVTYETELEVPNADLSLRPGMTATVDIRTSKAEGVLLVPSAALRFDPEKVDAIPKMGGPPKKSFLQSVVPGPPPRMGRPKANTDSVPVKTTKQDGARIWVLRNGRPEAIEVKTGLTNGRLTEVSGEGLTEGLPIIVRAAASMP